MPSPLPDYVPGPIRDVISRTKTNGLKGFAAKAGVPHTTLCWTFREGNYKSLEAFIRFCEGIDQDPDEIAGMLQRGELDLIKQLVQQRTSIRGLAKSGSTSHGYVYQLMDGLSGKKVVELYLPIAKASGMSLKEFSALLIK